MGRYRFNSERRVRRALIPSTLEAQTRLAIANSASDIHGGIKEVWQISENEFAVYQRGNRKRGRLVASYKHGALTND